MRNLVWTLASMVLVVCVNATAWSSEADELRAKAKAVQPLVEKMITLAKRDTLHTRRQAAEAMLVIVGLVYRTPFPVQPMKAIGAAAITSPRFRLGSHPRP